MHLSKRLTAILCLIIRIIIAVFCTVTPTGATQHRPHITAPIDARTDQSLERIKPGELSPNWIPALQSPAPARKTWGPDRRLTNDSGDSLLGFNFARSVAADDTGRTHVIWYDNRDGQQQIYYKRSIDGGFNWEPDLRLSPHPARQEHPSIALSGDNIYIVWHDTRDGGLNIYIKRSTDGGANWEPDVRLSSSGSAAHASIAASGSSVSVVWGDSRDGQAEIYTRASSDGALSWGEEIRLSELPYASWVPTVAVSGRNVYAAWVDTRDDNEEEYFRSSTDGGASWGPVMRLTNNAANSWAPSMVASGETVHIVWFDQQDAPIQPLGAEQMLDEVMKLLGLKVNPAPAGVMVAHPELVAQRRATEKMQLIQREAPGWIARGGDAAKLQAILREFEEMGQRGASYLEKERKLDEAFVLMGLSYTPGSLDGLPKINYLDAMRIRVQDKLKQIQAAAPAWVRNGGDLSRLDALLKEFERAMALANSEWEIYYLRSTDGGATWGGPTRLTEAPGPSARPSIAMAGKGLHVVWFDGRDGNLEVYYKHSPNAGATWGPDVRLTDAPADSMHPTVAATGNATHVVWFDQRDGDAEIYYKQTVKRVSVSRN